jgi:hypothetical protein
MKKINASLLLLIVCSQFLFTSCVSEWFGISGKGKIATESRAAKDFQSVQLLTSADVTIEKDTLFYVSVEDYDNIVKYISAKVVNGTLIITTYPSSTILTNSKAKVHITMPDSLLNLTIAGSGNIDVYSSFKTIKDKQQTFQTNGGGSITLHEPISLNGVIATIMGSGNITATGSAKILTTSTSGSGNMYFSNMAIEDVKSVITGSGSVYVNATKTLNGKISGSGNIEYTGSPSITSTITGSGNIFNKN